MAIRKILVVAIVVAAGAGVFWFATSSPSPSPSPAETQKSGPTPTLNATPIPTPSPTPVVSPRLGESGPQVKVSSLSVEQGEMVVVTAENIEPTASIRGVFDGKDFNFLAIGQKKEVGFIGIHAQLNPGIYTLSVNLGGDTIVKKNVQVVERKFPVTVLYVSDELKDKGFSENNIIESQGADEGKIIAKAIAGYTPSAYFEGAFSYPLKTIKDVGAFGNIRKGDAYIVQHLGVDLDAEIGTPVRVINSGKVVVSKELYSYGNTIVVDHGLGIYSLYLHLLGLPVKEGQMVKKGEIIAVSGNSGYSIAPHLHFSVKVSKASVDPLKFFETVNPFLYGKR